jgi:hypothetical protein
VHTESHTPARLAVTFDDDRAVAGAGLALVATLSERLELVAAANEVIELDPATEGVPDEARSLDPGVVQGGSERLEHVFVSPPASDCVNVHQDHASARPEGWRCADTCLAVSRTRV